MKNTFKLSSIALFLSLALFSFSSKASAAKLTGGKIGTWNFDNDSIFTGTKVTNSGYAASGSFTISGSGGLNIEQSSDMDLTSTQQLISTNAAEVESALKADLKTAYDNSQDGSAEAVPPILGSSDSEVDQETRNTTINNTVNKH